MLSDELHSHLDKLADIEKQLQDDIDTAIKNIDREALMDDPQGTLLDIVNGIKLLVLEKYIPISGQLGFDLSEIIKNKNIIVDRTKDPTLNEDE